MLAAGAAGYAVGLPLGYCYPSGVPHLWQARPLIAAGRLEAAGYAATATGLQALGWATAATAVLVGLVAREDRRSGRG